MFRAGITLLEQANNSRTPQEKSTLYDLALEEFHKLHGTPGAPLEYLGKALVYQALGDYIEEAKCFELAYRRYPRHPLLPVLQEQIGYRMHESSRANRLATFNFILLAIRYLPSIASNNHSNKLFKSLEKHWEKLYFIEAETQDELPEDHKNIAFALKIAFWLARPYVISELIDELFQMPELCPITLGNALFALIELGSYSLAKVKLDDAERRYQTNELEKAKGLSLEMIQIALLKSSASIEAAVEAFLRIPPPTDIRQSERVLFYLMESALDEGKTDLIHTLYIHTEHYPLSTEGRFNRNACEIWALMLDKDWSRAGNMLHQYPLELLSQETSILHFLYGCWLYVTEGKEIAFIHFSGVFEVPYPRTWTLFSYFLRGKISENEGWMTKSFLWERRQLFRQLALFYFCAGDETKSLEYQQRAQKEVVDVDDES
jgi:serine/threonine-protein kinase